MHRTSLYLPAVMLALAAPACSTPSADDQGSETTQTEGTDANEDATTLLMGSTSGADPSSGTVDPSSGTVDPDDGGTDTDTDPAACTQDPPIPGVSLDLEAFVEGYYSPGIGTFECESSKPPGGAAAQWPLECFLVSFEGDDDFKGGVYSGPPPGEPFESTLSISGGESVLVPAGPLTVVVYDLLTAHRVSVYGPDGLIAGDATDSALNGYYSPPTVHTFGGLIDAAVTDGELCADGNECAVPVGLGSGSAVSSSGEPIVVEGETHRLWARGHRLIGCDGEELELWGDRWSSSQLAHYTLLSIAR